MSLLKLLRRLKHFAIIIAFIPHKDSVALTNLEIRQQDREVK